MTGPHRSPPAPWRLVLVVGTAYAVGSAVSFALFEASAIGAVFFPPAGVTFAALVLTEQRRWPWVLGTAAVVEAAVDLLFGLPAWSVAGFVLANVAEPLVGVLLLRRFVPRVDLRRRRDLGAFIGCGVVAGPVVGGLIGATTNDLALARDWFDAFFPFWAGDGLGVLTVAGTVLTWRDGDAWPSPGTTLRRALLLAVAAGVTVLAFWPTTVPLSYTTIALLVVYAVRWGVPLVTAAGLAVTLTANVMTAAGRGPWAPLAGAPNLEIASLQLFLAVAVLTAWLLAVEIGERQEARTVSERERAVRRRVEALQEVTAGLATAATSEAIAQVIVRRGIGLVADQGAVGVLTPDGARLRSWSTSPADPAPAERDLPLDAPALIAVAACSGRPVRAQLPAPLRVTFPAGLAGEPYDDSHSALAVPARIGEVTVGALGFGFGSDAAVDEDVAAVATTLAELMAQALLRARLYERDHEAAHELQRAFLPALPEHLPGIDVAGCYRPADQEHDIGGDWYDVFPVAEGRTALVVGDVVGHDLPAAAAMGRLETALRVIAGGPHTGPRQVLEALDEACPAIPGAAFATLGYGEYDPHTCLLRYACAGHPPPLLVTDHRTRYLEGGRSTPLAVAAGPRAEAELTVPPGSMLVWYSDGLVERRGSDLDAGMGRLAEVAARIDGDDPAVWRDVVMTELTGDGHLRDDVVLLCLRLGAEQTVDGDDPAAREGVRRSAPRASLRLVAAQPAGGPAARAAEPAG
ncbi:SpoIIE family protein phosphatase [Geodermatophilus sp. SYSU D00703]